MRRSVVASSDEARRSGCFGADLGEDVEDLPDEAREPGVQGGGEALGDGDARDGDAQVGHGCALEGGVEAAEEAERLDG